MNQLGTVYATKRRRRNGKSLKPSPKESSGKSNPSKRHRERLNAELDTLASLLPFEASILSKLDRLSILRLSVSYLRTKSYFQVSCHKGGKGDQHGHFLLHDNQFRNRDLTVYDSPALDGECFLQALNGFLLILTSDGEVFFATHTIESYLGFHQSDVVHQSVYELVHSEDREELQRQLTWNSQLPPDSGLGLMDALRPDNAMILERSFTVRFRCLLDNTSGFLRLDIRGRVKVLHGQNRKTEEPPLALFAICTPFGPPSLLELPHKESMFKSKHRLDLALVSMDQRGKTLLGYGDAELSTLGGYDLVHYDDLAYVASAHQELLKTGASGLIAYRLQAKDGQFQWLQTSSRLVYKNSKPDFIISTHRPLMEEEGRDLLGKRTMDFKVSYLDAGLTSSYFSDESNLSSAPATNAATTPNPPQTALSSAPASHAGAQQRVGRKYKNQLRDFLTNCRTKRKSGSSASTPVGNATPPEPSPYLSAGEQWPSGGAAAVSSGAAVAYSPSVYPAAAAVPYHADNGFYMHHHHHQLHHQSNALPNLPNLHQSFYAPALDNRFGIPAAEHNLFHAHHGYRSLAGVGVGVGVGAAGYYAADYSPYVHAATTNGFLAAGYDSTMGMSQLYGSSNSSPGGASPASVDAASGKYPAAGIASSVTSSSSLPAVPPIRLGLHHHTGGGLLSSGETEASETSSTGVSSSSSITGGDSPYSNGHLHQQPASRSSRPSSRKPGDQQQQQQQQQMMQPQQAQQMNGLVGVSNKGVDDLAKGDGRHSSGSSAYAANGAANDTRQTVLMWGSSGGSCHSSDSMTAGELITSANASAYSTECGEKGAKYGHLGYNGSLTAISGHHGHQQPGQQSGQQSGQQQLGHQVDAKSSPGNNNAPDGLNSACKWGRVGSHYLYGAAASVEAAASTEVSWPHHHHVTHHQYHPYPYHHYHNHHHQVHHHQTHHDSSVSEHRHQAYNSSSNLAGTVRTEVLCCPSLR